jgi:hypothetical protein
MSQSTIIAAITKDDTCTALDITAKSSSPVLALCRKLVEAGHDPATPLHAYRGETLALKIRSIGEAARLRVSPHGVGFIWDRDTDEQEPRRFVFPSEAADRAILTKSILPALFAASRTRR